MPNSLITLAIITNMDAPISTKPSINAWLISTTRCNVLLQFFSLMLTLMIAKVEWIAAIWLFYPLASFLLLAHLTNPSKYSSSFGIIRMVSMGVKEIFPLMKWDKILDFTTISTPMFAPFCSSLTLPFSCSSIRLAVIGNLLLGILTLENIC